MIIRQEWVLSANSLGPASDLYQEIFDFLNDRPWGWFELHHASDDEDEVIYPQLLYQLKSNNLESILLLC